MKNKKVEMKKTFFSSFLLHVVEMVFVVTQNNNAMQFFQLSKQTFF
jgi:hypothetical protein